MGIKHATSWSSANLHRTEPLRSASHTWQALVCIFQICVFHWYRFPWTGKLKENAQQIINIPKNKELNKLSSLIKKMKIGWEMMKFLDFEDLEMQL